MPLPRRDSHRISQTRECHRNAPAEDGVDGRAHRRRRWLSRVDGRKAGGDLRLQELAGGAVGAVLAATVSNGDCKKNTGTIEDNGATGVLARHSTRQAASLQIYFNCRPAAAACTRLWWRP